MNKVPVATAILTLSIASSAFGATVTCDYGSPDPAAPAELSQFAFLIGDYRIDAHSWQGDGWSPPAPGFNVRWNGRYGLDGMVIIDEWFNPVPSEDRSGNRGVNVRMYDPEEMIWKMMWVATANKQVQDMRAEVRDGVLTMWQVYPDRPHFKAIFNVHDADHWERVSFTHDEAGEWVRQYKLAATRIPCEG